MTTPRVRWSALLIIVVSLLSGQSTAENKTQLSTAMAAVVANMDTPSGKQYDAAIGKEFPPKYSGVFHDCKPSTEKVPPSFDVFLKLDAQGKVIEMLAYPETTMAQCVRPSLSSGKFSPPPHGDYWVSIHLQFKK